MSKKFSFHFDIGNSATGPIGFCARVDATSAERALEKLKDAIAESVEVHSSDPDIDYITVYFNADAITVDDVDSEDELAE